VVDCSQGVPLRFNEYLAPIFFSGHGAEAVVGSGRFFEIDFWLSAVSGRLSAACSHGSAGSPQAGSGRFTGDGGRWILGRRPLCRQGTTGRPLRPRHDMVASSLRFGSGELDHRYRKKGVLPPPPFLRNEANFPECWRMWISLGDSKLAA
jgi:hypothetical protein